MFEIITADEFSAANSPDPLGQAERAGEDSHAALELPRSNVGVGVEPSAYRMDSQHASTDAALPNAATKRADLADATDSPSTLVWCEFCKGSYNEYHFGDIEEGGE